MNKDKFLTELREYLSVLEKQEQEDILEEYAQHIDMKMQKGLSEEEAIGDFGSVEQLAAEILEAYHVNPDFRRQSFSFKLPRMMTGGARGSIQPQAGQSYGNAPHKDGNIQEETGLGKLCRRVKNMVTGALRGIGNAFRWTGRKCRAVGEWLIKPFKRGRRSKSGESVKRNGTLTERTNDMGGYVGRCFRAVGRGIVTLCRWGIAGCIFCLKFMWNAAWLLFALFCAGFAMITLMGTGTLLVFLVQGYPFIGFFLICLGGLLCLGTLSYGAFTLLIRKKKNSEDENHLNGLQNKTDEAPGQYEEKAIMSDKICLDVIPDEMLERYEEKAEKYGKEAAYE